MKECGRDSDPCFVSSGFNNWKTALEEGRGLLKHASSQIHQTAAAMWAKKTARTDTNLTIQSQLSAAHVERNRYYIKSIGEVVQFLAVNELSFRGDVELPADNAVDEPPEPTFGGLFMKMFEFAMSKDAHLRSISQTVPKNAKYTSPLIQNDVMVMAEMVQEVIVNECKNSDRCILHQM